MSLIQSYRLRRRHIKETHLTTHNPYYKQRAVLCDIPQM